jgi:hypothetical protein
VLALMCINASTASWTRRSSYTAPSMIEPCRRGWEAADAAGVHAAAL